MRLSVCCLPARGIVIALCALGVLFGLKTSTAFAQTESGERLYVVTYVDIFPAGGGTEKANALLRQFAADSRKDSGCTRFDLLQDIGRANHFSIVEVWKDRAAWDAHVALEHTRRFREQIQPLLGSPFDERLYHALP